MRQIDCPPGTSTLPRLLLRFCLCLLVLSCAPAGMLWAGPWQQEKGRGFLSLSSVQRRAADHSLASELGLYGEYGITPRLTLGVDANQRDLIAGHALLFLRMPISSADQGLRASGQIALGGSHDLGRWGAMQRLTLSFGNDTRHRRRTPGPDLTGWWSVDLAVERRAGRPSLWKLDATWGLNSWGMRSGSRFAPLVQIETTGGSGVDLAYGVTPSIRYRLNDRRDLLFGVEVRDDGQRSLGLKLALWHRF